MLWSWFAETTLFVAVLILIAMVLGRWVSLKPAFRHAFWLLVLVKMVTPPLISAPLPAPFLAYQEHAKPNPPVSPAPPFLNESPPAQAEPIPNPAPILKPIPKASTSFLTWELAERWAFVIWIVGSFIVLCGQIRAFVGVHRRCQWQTPCPDWLRLLNQEVAKMLNIRAPALVFVKNLNSPAIWCWKRPRLLIPENLVEHFDSKSWRIMLTHELAHVARRDHWIVWLELAAMIIWWWNPLFWFVRRQLHIEADRACDAWVGATWPQDRRAYADLLLDICQLHHDRKAKVLVGTLGLGNSSQILEKRLVMILRNQQIPNRLSPSGILMLALLAIATLPAWSWSQQRGPQPKFQANSPNSIIIKPGKYALAPVLVNPNHGSNDDREDQDLVQNAQDEYARAGIQQEIAKAELQKAEAEYELKVGQLAALRNNKEGSPRDQILKAQAEAKIAMAEFQIKTANQKEAKLGYDQTFRTLSAAMAAKKQAEQTKLERQKEEEQRRVAEKTVEEQIKKLQAARKADEERIAKEFKPQVYRAQVGDLITIEVLEALAGRPITGQKVVRQDGTISLGWYGEVQVYGLTRVQIKEKVIEQLRKFLNDDALGLFAGDDNGKLVVVPPAESERVYIEEIITDRRDPASKSGVKINQPENTANKNKPYLQSVIDVSPKSAVVAEILETEADFNFPKGSTLNTLMEKVALMTKCEKLPKGVTFYIEPNVREILNKHTSTFALDLQGIPIAMGMNLAMKQLQLNYQISNGIIMINFGIATFR